MTRDEGLDLLNDSGWSYGIHVEVNPYGKGFLVCVPDEGDWALPNLLSAASFTGQECQRKADAAAAGLAGDDAVAWSRGRP